MPRSTRWAAVVGATVVMLAACTSNTSDPSSTSASATEVSSPALSTSTPAASIAPTLPSSSFVTPTPSVADPTTPNPWPDALTPEQVADAQLALDAYRGYWAMVDTAIARPGQDWTQQIAQYATGPAEDKFLQTLKQLVERGTYADGKTIVTPHVTDVQQALVVIVDCVDKTNTDLLDSTGKSVKAPDAPGTYFRHTATSQMVQADDGRWILALKTDNWSQSC